MIEFPEAEIIKCGSVELEVFQAGHGGLPVLLAHGWPEHAFSWRYQIPALVEHGYHVIVPNQRGYGSSSSPAEVEAYDCQNLTSDHIALLDVLGVDKAVFVGHDWGALVVWYQPLLNPDRVLGVANLSVPFLPKFPADPVTLMEQANGPDFYIVHFNRQPGVAAAAFAANTKRFLTNMYRTKFWYETDEKEPSGMTIVDMARIDLHRGELMMSEEELEVFVAAFQSSGFEGPCNWYRNFTRNWELTADIEFKVEHPALMIYGEHDMVRPVDMSGTVSDLEVHTLECGHWIQQEKPNETNGILVDWLNRRMKPLY